MQKRTHIGAYIDAEQRRQLIELARRDDRSVSSVIRQALKAHVDREQAAANRGVVAIDRGREPMQNHPAELEQQHGAQVVDARPDLAEAAQALQRVRAAAAADKLGIVLRGDGRPLPGWLVAELSRVLRRVLLRPEDADTLG